MSRWPKTSFASEEAINALVRRGYEHFDAPIGDASCQARPPVVSDAAAVVERYMDGGGSRPKHREAVLALVAAYEALHARDPPDGRVKEPGDLANEGRGSEAYERFFAEIEAQIGSEHLALLSAFYSKSADCTKSFTVFDSSFARRDHFLYYGTTAEAEATKDPRLHTDMDSPLKAAVGQGNVDYIYRSLNGIRQYGEVNDSLSSEYPAKVTLPNDQVYEVGQSFALFLAVFYLDWQARRPLIVSVRRIQVNDAGLVWDGSEVLLWEPNGRGSWTYVPDPTEAQGNQAGTYYNMWSTYRPGAAGEGLDSSDTAVFLDMLKAGDLPVAILRYAAVHPSYAGRADRKEFPGEAALIANSERISAGHAVDDTHCAGLHFSPEAAPGQAQALPGLVTLWAVLSRAGFNIKDAQEVQEAPGQPDIRVYTDRTVNLAVNHVSRDTFAHVRRRTDMLWDRYAAAGRPRLGRFMVRYGSQAVHFESMADAAAFNKLRSNKQKAAVAKMDVARLYEK
ncbi:uncharacterized protein PG986_014678 [Apiospora aurea]|uniref:Uncharacterized protein n=1 Tax=Apiospora aurea TaxID=335848 RepID=A0ABR1PU77_9PEZI